MKMCLISLFFPLLFCYFVLLVTFTINRKYTTYRGIFYSFCGFLSVFVLYLIVVFDDVILKYSISEFSWAVNATNWLSLEVMFSLRIDALSYLFVLLVSVIGLATNFYILNYLKYEAQEDVFTLLINWFMFSMIVLVLGNNLFTLFLGWESIGLSSFFLINFWNTRRGTVKSSFKAFFFNRMSDVFLFIFLLVINYVTYLNNLGDLNAKVALSAINTTDVYALSANCLFMCTLFKSAQIIGHLWLPDSMEAPVPASALIHSATLVSAGIYLLLRFTPLVVLNNLQSLSMLVGALTAAYGGIVSASQTDMKKLLAYSTISHCGFLFVTIGTELYTASIIYLFLHGLFKASTFFCAGSFIRVAGSQDTRNMGALNRVLPVDTVFLIICAFNLGGLPFSLGYLYKAMLMSAALNSTTALFTLGLCVVGLLSSVIYVYRLVYYSAFDVAKEFFAPIIYELQQKQINIVNNWSLTTIIQILAVSIILIFAIWIYCIFNAYFVSSNLILDHMPVLFQCDSHLLVDMNFVHKNYYELFYGLYVLLFSALVVVSWRTEYTFSFKLNYILTASLSGFALVLWSMFV